MTVLLIITAVLLIPNIMISWFLVYHTLYSTNTYIEEKTSIPNLYKVNDNVHRQYNEVPIPIFWLAILFSLVPGLSIAIFITLFICFMTVCFNPEHLKVTSVTKKLFRKNDE